MHVTRVRLQVGVAVRGRAQPQFAERGLWAEVARREGGQRFDGRALQVGADDQVLVGVEQGVTVTLWVVGVDFKSELALAGRRDGEHSLVVHHAVHHVTLQGFLFHGIAFQLGREAQFAWQMKLDFGLTVDSGEDGTALHGLNVILIGTVPGAPARVHTRRECHWLHVGSLHLHLVFAHATVHTLFRRLRQILGIEDETVRTVAWRTNCEERDVVQHFLKQQHKMLNTPLHLQTAGRLQF